MLRKGVRAQVRVILDDQNRNTVPDIQVVLDASRPGFAPIHIETLPRDVPVAEMRELVEKVLSAVATASPKLSEGIDQVAGAIAFMTGTGQRGVLQFDLGDQNRNGRLDLQMEAQGYLAGFRLPTLDSGIIDIPIEEALSIASVATAVLPQPGALIALTIIDGVRLAVRLIPV